MENIQKQMQELFGASCYAYCIAYLFGEATTIKGQTRLVLEGWFNNSIDDDGYVSKPLQYIKGISGLTYKDVKKIDLNSLSELPDGLWIVEYRLNNKQHFVVANKDGVIFDPAGDSNTVKNGKPFTYRYYIK